ncbi:alpha-L-rhamnosidase [Algibacter sp. L3A6]|uniref:alpha-L-rhamnosidase n=1 Tax=Algibacter sp. L3A6 TaxID=2686366 RepID=UPI00131B02A6|nr:alpha-L-rhamnosidase [Algibacter sp. L3A6]
MKIKFKMNSRCFSLPFIAILFTFMGCNSENSTRAGKITSLKVEGFDHWIVTDEPTPKLSWQPMFQVSEKKVIGYELLVADNKNNLKQNHGNLLELTVTKIENGPWFYFDASKLPSRTVALWRVRAVLEDDSYGAWSETFHFEVGLKNKSDWSGKWIGMQPELRQKSAPWFRNSFEINKTITKARLYVCGLGMHESWLNGKKIGNELLQPAQTDYNIRSFYVGHDVSSLINQGQNTLGFWLGDGFYNQDRVWGANGLSYGQPKVLAQLEITFNDGSTSIISTDENWLCKPSAITASNVYAGENYDSNLYDPLWAKNHNDTSNWKPVKIETTPGRTLVAQQLPPCRITDSVSVKEIKQLHPNTWIFDFDQNLVGWAKMKIDARPNTKITIRFAEDKLSSGELNFATSGVRATKVIQTDNYICKGEGEEIWEPRFTYHGFRFAEVTISNGELKNKIPTKDLLQGMVVHTDMTVTGEFSSSDDTLNRIFDIAHWTQSGGVLGIPMDCPVRERCGWTGDAHLTVPYTMYRFDAASMWRKYTTDIATTAELSAPMLCFGDEFGERTRQIKKSGIPTMVAPGKRFIGEGSPDWGSAIAFIPWDIYVHTGDTRSLKEHYSSIKQWTEHLQGISTHGIVYSGMGDWCKPIVHNPEEKTEREIYGKITPMLSTACYYRSARIAADIAQRIGKQEDYLYFDKLASDIRKAFTNAFYGKDRLLIPDQTTNAIAVDWQVLAPEHQAQAAEALNQQVITANYHFETGVFGMPSLWPVLGRFGYHETIWKTLQNETAPSFKHLMSKGATTFWEVWPTENDYIDDYKQSMSHPFQAAFVSWFYEGLAGIKPDSKAPGYRLINLEPQIIPELEWVKCQFLSPMGLIESSWNQKESILSWQVEIPTGAEAQLRVPGKLINVERDSKNFKTETYGITGTQSIGKKLTLKAGKYTITSKLNN